jgi:poly-gamma-glutamate synthesis protein (capsule biosynthesis protein)
LKSWYPERGLCLILRGCIIGLFHTIILCACHAQPEYAYLGVTYHEAYQAEKLFLKSLLEDKEPQLEALGIRLLPDESSAESMVEPAISIQCLASWEYEAHFGELVISKTYVVPQEDAFAGRRDTTLAACIQGEETLVAFKDLKPPYIALRVDGLSLEAEKYPLVKVVGISIQTEPPSDEPDDSKIDEEKRTSLQAKVQGLKALLEAEPKPLIEESPEILWIASAGDLMLGRGASEILLKEGPEGIFGGTAEFLLKADLALVNLEGAVSNRGTKVQKSFNFRFDPQVAPALRAAGIDGVLLANNHVFDYGEEGFLDSLAYLEKAGIQVLGAGLEAEAAAKPFIFTKGSNGARIFGIASFPQEKNGWDPLGVAATEGKPGLLHTGKGGGEKLKPHFSKDDNVLDIVLFHGGDEWSKGPNSATRELYQDLIQHGADLIIGSHPHIVQGFEWVLGKAVFWSLGNYVFGGMDNTGGGDEGLFIRLGYSGTKLAYLEPYPLALNHTRTDIAPMEKLDRFYQRSKELQLKP